MLVLVRAAALAGGCANCVRGFYSKEDTCSERGGEARCPHSHQHRSIQRKPFRKGQGVKGGRVCAARERKRLVRGTAQSIIHMCAKTCYVHRRICVTDR